ncbi:MAG: lipoyl(octanoyl) transferase LipB [Desulfobacterales bacterium]|nr:lipoyl(octanoyl) transferase LipB [Desulfobacterales bacterium]
MKISNNNESTKWSLVLDGLTSYKDAHELQVALVQARRGQFDRDIFICLEHPPVFTLGRRGGLGGLKVPEDFLKSQGIDIVHVERGGDITYHGPGQIVLYPIMDLRFSKLSVVDYVTSLEEVMIRTAANWSISAERNPLNRGIWVGQRKLGSVGIAVRRSITFHGLALNVNTMLEHFGWIDPCGLKGVSAVSMAQLHGSLIDMCEVRRALLVHVEDVFGAALEPIGLEEVREMLNNEPQNIEHRISK